MGEDLADVVAAGAEHGEDGVAGGALERAAGEAASVFMWPISGARIGVRSRRVPLIS
jgi:hypothetical protein